MIHSAPRRFSTGHRHGRDGDIGEAEKAQQISRTWGDKLVLVGLSLRGAAMFPQLAGMCRLLRFAGTAPMVMGAVVTVYEVGGWTGVLAIPTAGVVFATAGTLSDKMFEERLRAEIRQDIAAGCPEAPKELLEAAKLAPMCEYETNRIRLDVKWPAEPTTQHEWQIVCYGVRDNMSRPWSVKSLRVSSGV